MITTERKWNGDEVISDFDKGITRSLFEGAVTVEGRAALLAPVDLGNLRASITFTVEGAGSFPGIEPGADILGTAQIVTAGKGEALIGTVVFYAIYTEFGTRFIKAQAFLEPAFEESLSDIEAFFVRNLRGLKWVQ